MNTRDNEQIKRFTFPACARNEHDTCPGWQSGYVDGALRQAGEQCDCVCHATRKGGDHE